MTEYKMEDHIKYPKIENIHNRPASISNETICVITEKIHGSNFSFTTDGKTVKCAKRQ